MVEWLTSTSGMLITSGVLLLLLAVLLYVIGNSKEKKNNQKVETKEEIKASVEEIPETPIVEIKEEVEVHEEPIVEVKEETIEIPVEIREDTYEMKIPTEIEDLKAETLEEVKPEEEQEEVIKFTYEDEQARPVYGGNDPLENTQILSEGIKKPYGGADLEINQEKIDVE